MAKCTACGKHIRHDQAVIELRNGRFSDTAGDIRSRDLAAGPVFLHAGEGSRAQPGCLSYAGTVKWLRDAGLSPSAFAGWPKTAAEGRERFPDWSGIRD